MKVMTTYIYVANVSRGERMERQECTSVLGKIDLKFHSSLRTRDVTTNRREKLLGPVRIRSSSSNRIEEIMFSLGSNCIILIQTRTIGERRDEN